MERFGATQDQVSYVVCYVTLHDDFIDAGVLYALADGRTGGEAR